MNSENQLQFNLQEGIDNPEKAPEIVRSVQAAFTELSNSSLAALEAAKQSKNLAEEYSKQVQLLTQSNVDLTSAMKNIHIILNSKSDLFKGDAEMQEVMAGLSMFVVGSGAIKMGVFAKGMEDAKSQS